MTRSPLPWLALIVAPACTQAAADQPHQGGFPPTAAELAQVTAGVRVEVARVRLSEPEVSIQLPGEVRGSHDVVLSAALGGVVQQILVDDGDVVARGTVLARVDADIYAAQLEQAQAQARLAEAELARVKALGDLASAQALLQAETQAVIANSAADLARAQLSRATVVAPFGGTVASVQAEEGEVVGPGRALLRLVDLDPVVIVLSVPDRDVVSLEPGLPARVTTASATGVFEGKVRHVSPAADLSTRAFPVEVEVPNPEGRLLPGMIARVTVQRDLGAPQIVVPQDFIVTARDTQGVFVDRDGTAVWTTVELGQVLRDQVIVRSGLVADDRVVVTGHRELVDGDRLIVSREGVCCENGRPVF